MIKKMIFLYAEAYRKIITIIMENTNNVYLLEPLIYIRNLYIEKPCTECTSIGMAASMGHLMCLVRLHENGYKMTTYVCIYAAQNGHIDCLDYAYVHNCPWDERTCEAAATNGHLDCLQYAHENSCPWDEYTCAFAAKYGYLDCLQYAHIHNCPWNKRVCFWAEANGHIECLEYAHRHKCPCDHLNKINIKIKKYETSLDTISDNIDTECSVCMTNSHKVQFMPCGHCFCVYCSNRLIAENVDLNCPLCRGSVKDTVLLTCTIKPEDYLLIIEDGIFD